MSVIERMFHFRIPIVKAILTNSVFMAACFVVRDQNGQQLAYIYFEDERGGHPPRSFSPKTMKDRREYC
jgi:hypothetical protein